MMMDSTSYCCLLILLHELARIWNDNGDVSVITRVACLRTHIRTYIHTYPHARLERERERERQKDTYAPRAETLHHGKTGMPSIPRDSSTPHMMLRF